MQAALPLVCNQVFNFIKTKVTKIVEEKKDAFCADPKGTVLELINDNFVMRTAYGSAPPEVHSKIEESLDKLKGEAGFQEICNNSDKEMVKKKIGELLDQAKARIPQCNVGGQTANASAPKLGGKSKAAKSRKSRKHRKSRKSKKTRKH